MKRTDRTGTPESPETQPQEVRQLLHQEEISHEGQQRTSEQASENRAEDLGAVETEVTPITPPMVGPGDLVGNAQTPANTDDFGVEPGEELHGG